MGNAAQRAKGCPSCKCHGSTMASMACACAKPVKPVCLPVAHQRYSTSATTAQQDTQYTVAVRQWPMFACGTPATQQHHSVHPAWMSEYAIRVGLECRRQRPRAPQQHPSTAAQSESVTASPLVQVVVAQAPRDPATRLPRVMLLRVGCGAVCLGRVAVEAEGPFLVLVVATWCGEQREENSEM